MVTLVILLFLRLGSNSRRCRRMELGLQDLDMILPSPILQPSTMTWTQKTTGSNNCIEGELIHQLLLEYLGSLTSDVQATLHGPVPGRSCGMFCLALRCLYFLLIHCNSGLSSFTRCSPSTRQAWSVMDYSEHCMIRCLRINLGTSREGEFYAILLINICVMQARYIMV